MLMLLCCIMKIQFSKEVTQLYALGSNAKRRVTSFEIFIFDVTTQWEICSLMTIVSQTMKSRFVDVLQTASFDWLASATLLYSPLFNTWLCVRRSLMSRASLFRSRLYSSWRRRSFSRTEVILNLRARVVFYNTGVIIFYVNFIVLSKVQSNITGIIE